MMTPDRLKEIRERADKATKGQWELRVHPGAEANPDLYGRNFHVSARTPENHPYFECTPKIEILSDEDYPTKRDDAYFVAHARQDIPDLLSALDEARELLKEIRVTDEAH